MKMKERHTNIHLTLTCHNDVNNGCE